MSKHNQGTDVANKSTDRQTLNRRVGFLQRREVRFSDWSRYWAYSHTNGPGNHSVAPNGSRGTWNAVPILSRGCRSWIWQPCSLHPFCSPLIGRGDTVSGRNG